MFEFIDWSVEISPAFIHFLTDCLGDFFIDEIRKLDQSTNGGLGIKINSSDELPPVHQCCPRSYISAEEKLKFSTELQKFLMEEDGLES